VSEAIGYVVIDHAYSLHVGVTDGFAYEFEAAFFEVFAHACADFGFCWYLFAAFPLVLNGFAVDKVPYVFCKGAEFCLYFFERNCVASD